jgi:hypothetical protein
MRKRLGRVCHPRVISLPSPKGWEGHALPVPFNYVFEVLDVNSPGVLSEISLHPFQPWKLAPNWHLKTGTEPFTNGLGEILGWD